MNGLIDQPNSILLSEIEPVLVKSRHIGVLAKLYRHHGDDTRLLDAWAKLVDGQWTDPDVQDPLSRIFDLLSEKKDRTLIQKWVGWLVKKDSERALKVRRLFVGVVDFEVKTERFSASTVDHGDKTESGGRQGITATNTRSQSSCRRAIARASRCTTTKHSTCTLIENSRDRIIDRSLGLRPALATRCNVYRPAFVMSRRRINIKALARKRHVARSDFATC